MNWQTFTTFLILATAAGIIVRRVGIFLRSGKSGHCGGCAGCGHSEELSGLLPLVQLTAMQEPRVNRPLSPTGNDELRTTFPGNIAAGAEKKR